MIMSHFKGQHPHVLPKHRRMHRNLRLRTERDTQIARSMQERRAYVACEVEAILTAAYGLDADLVTRTTSAA